MHTDACGFLAINNDSALLPLGRPRLEQLRRTGVQSQCARSRSTGVQPTSWTHAHHPNGVAFRVVSWRRPTTAGHGKPAMLQDSTTKPALIPQTRIQHVGSHPVHVLPMLQLTSGFGVPTGDATRSGGDSCMCSQACAPSYLGAQQCRHNESVRTLVPHRVGNRPPQAPVVPVQTLPEPSAENHQLTDGQPATGKPTPPA